MFVCSGDNVKNEILYFHIIKACIGIREGEKKEEETVSGRGFGKGN